jgi:hypothetical protein
MKKQIFTIILFTIVSLNVLGQSFKLDATGANDMRLRTNNIDRVNILTNGNVGMGVTAPVTRLHIDGASNNGTTATLKITNGGSSAMLFDGDEIDATPNGALLLNNNSTGNVILGTGGGKIGIGTSGPATPFHVYGGASGIVPNPQYKYFFEDDADHFILMASPDAMETGITFAKPNSTANIFNLVGGGLSFRTNSVTRMTILDGGNSGVGTSTPDTKLHVEGTVESNGTTGTFKVTNGASSMLFDGNEIDVAGNNPMYLNYNSSGNVNLAFGGGSVGVGTASPDTKLQVEGTVDNNGTTGVFKVTSTGGASMLFDGNEIDGASNGGIYLNNNSTGGVYIGANGTGLKEIIKATVSIPTFTVNANLCSSRLISVANAAVDSAVSASPDNAIATGLIIAYAQVSSVGTVLIRICNFTGAPITQATSDFHVAVVR